MDILYVKSIHIVFVVSWFAALFYIVRLFIYTREAQEKPEPEKSILTAQLVLMQRKLWNIIGWPAMIGTGVFGVWMLIINPAYLYLSWMWLKLVMVALLFVYHLQCQRILSAQRRGEFRQSSLSLRFFNELATVLLVGIVFLAVVKSTRSVFWGVLGVIAFGATLMLAVVLFRKSAGKSKESGNRA